MAVLRDLCLLSLAAASKTSLTFVLSLVRSITEKCGI